MNPLLSVMLSIQLTTILALFLSTVKPATPLAVVILPEWQSLLRPEWESVLYRFFVAAAMALMFFFAKKRFPIKFVVVEAVLTALILSALFKKVVYAQPPQLASYALNWLLAAAALNKIFWPWISKGIDTLGEFICRLANQAFFERTLTLSMPAVIFLIIDVPDIPAVIARFFVGEQFHHNDSFMYGPGWAYVKGCILNMDIISQYGAGVGVVFGSLGKILGGFNYESGLLIMVWGAIIYYTLCFLLIRQWLSSALIASAGILYLIKLQMFHTGVYPFAFTYGSANVMRHWFDIIFFFAVFGHTIRPSLWFLVLAAFACGAQLFYIPSDGVYLTTAYIFYLLFQFKLSRFPLGLMFAAMPVIIAIVLLRIFIGPSVFSGEYLYNVREFVQYFLSGFGVTPIFSSLGDRNFLASLMGFVVPSVYVFTLLSIGTLLILKKVDRKYLFVCVVCVYGLTLYHYYVARSAVTSYYVVSVPYVLVLCFWAKKICDVYSQEAASKIKMVLLAVCAWALLTNHNFISYPNHLNLSHNPITDPLVSQGLEGGKPYFNHLFREYNSKLKVDVNSLGEADEGFVQESDFKSDDALALYYRMESDFNMDAQLIDQYVGKGDPVPVISSFEIKILMQADRKPYFYYFPLVISHPMRARNLVRTSIYTTDQLNKTINALERDKPPYIFVERVLLTRPVPKEFYYWYSSAMFLTDYVLEHYVPVAQGRYLTAMRIKS